MTCTATVGRDRCHRRCGVSACKRLNAAKRVIRCRLLQGQGSDSIARKLIGQILCLLPAKSSRIKGGVPGIGCQC